MSIGETVFQLVTADPTLNGMVGERVYPQVAPQGSALPRVVYFVVDDLPVNSLSGASPTRQARVQVDAYSSRYDEAQRVADALESLLASRTEPGLQSLSIGRRDVYEDDTDLHRVSLDFSIWTRRVST